MKESLNTLCQTAALIDFSLSLKQPNCAVVKGVAEATDHAVLTNNGWVGQNGNQDLKGKEMKIKMSKFSEAALSTWEVPCRRLDLHWIKFTVTSKEELQRAQESYCGQ